MNNEKTIQKRGHIPPGFNPLGFNLSRFMVYAYLQSRKNHAQKAFPSYSQIAGDLGINERTAEHAAKELAASALIEKKHYFRAIG